MSAGHISVSVSSTLPAGKDIYPVRPRGGLTFAPLLGAPSLAPSRRVQPPPCRRHGGFMFSDAPVSCAFIGQPLVHLSKPSILGGLPEPPMVCAPTAHIPLVTSGIGRVGSPPLTSPPLRTAPFTEQTKTSSHKGMTPHAELEGSVVQGCNKAYITLHP